AGRTPRSAALFVSPTPSTSSTGRSRRKAPRCPGWPPRLRPEGGVFGRAGVWGGSEEGGREELAEVWPSRASKSRMRCCRATIRAWAAAGVAAPMSGGRGSSVSATDRGIRRDRLGCNPQLASGLNAYRTHIQRLFKKLDAHSKLEAAARASQL